VSKWNHWVYMTFKNTETLFTSCTCCQETSSYILCTCSTLKRFSQNGSKFISVQSLHGDSDAIQVSHKQWCSRLALPSVQARQSRLFSFVVPRWWNELPSTTRAD